MLARAEQRITYVELFKSPFSYQAQVTQQLLRDSESAPPLQLNYLKILFEEYFEATVYNMFSFFSSILINTHPKHNYKQFKLEVAGTLLGEKYT